MKIIFLILLTTCVSAREFYPHMAGRAHTVKPKNLSYQIFPGTAGHTPFFMGTLSLGVLSRLEFGTIPIFYLSKNHQHNLTYKWNVIKGKKWNFALGGTTIRFKAEADANDTAVFGPITYVEFLYNTVIMNYFFDNPDFALGYMVNYATIKTDSPKANKYMEESRTRAEWLIDLSYRLNDKYHVVGGVGRLRTNTFEDILSDRLPWSFGASFTWKRPNQTFSTPTLGIHHILEVNRTIYLLSSNINF